MYQSGSLLCVEPDTGHTYFKRDFLSVNSILPDCEAGSTQIFSLRKDMPKCFSFSTSYCFTSYNSCCSRLRIVYLMTLQQILITQAKLLTGENQNRTSDFSRLDQKHFRHTCIQVLVVYILPARKDFKKYCCLQHLISVTAPV